jgi:hypothetical protein
VGVGVGCICVWRIEGFSWGKVMSATLVTEAMCSSRLQTEYYRRRLMESFWVNYISENRLKEVQEKVKQPRILDVCLGTL